MINRLGRIKNDLVLIAVAIFLCFAVGGFAETVRQKNVATYISFPITNSDGAYVSGASGLDSEYSYFSDSSGGINWADCTNEAAEREPGSGWYELSLTQAEMNHDYIDIQIKSTGNLTQGLLIRTVVGDPLNIATTDDGGTINVTSGKVDEVAVLTGHTAQTGDSYARLGAPAGASVSADIAAVKSDTAAILTDTSAVDTTAEMRAFLYGSDTPGATAANQTTIIGYVDDLETRLTATRAGYLDYINTIYGKLPTNYIMGSSVVTDKDDEIDAVLADTGTTLDGKLNVIDSIIDDILTDTGTTIPGTLASISTNVDEVLADTGTTLPASLSSIDSKSDTIDAVVDAILSDTGTDIPAAINGVDSKIDTAQADITTIDGIVDSILVDTGTTLDDLVDDLETRLTSARAGYLDKLNVTGTLANSDAASTYKADVSSLATSAEISALNDISAGDVWDVTLASHTNAGSTGYALNAAGAAGDPWSTSLPGAYSAGSAGYIVGTNLDALISSRLATSGYTAPDNASITAILEDTGTTLPGSLSNLSTKIDTAQADLDNPAQYKATGFSTHSAADVWAVGTRTITGLTAAALADFFDTNSGTNYESAVAGSVVKEIADNAGGSSLSEDGIADAVWDELQSGHTTEGSFGYYLDSQISGITASISDADIDKIWDELLSGHTTAGSTGKYLSDIYDATDGNKEGASYSGIETMIRTNR